MSHDPCDAVYCRSSRQTGTATAGWVPQVQSSVSAVQARVQKRFSPEGRQTESAQSRPDKSQSATAETIKFDRSDLEPEAHENARDARTAGSSEVTPLPPP